MTTYPQQTTFRKIATFIGGPYDGAMLGGETIPDTVIVDDKAMRLTPTPTGGVKFVRTKATGRYTAGNEYVNLYGNQMDYCELLSTDECLLDDAESDIGEDGSRCVLLFVKYTWQTINQPCDPRDA